MPSLAFPQPHLEGLSLFVKHPTGSDRFSLRTCLGSHGRLCSCIFSLFLCYRLGFPVSRSVSQPQALGHGKRSCQTCILTSVPLAGGSFCLRPCTCLVFFILHVIQTGNLGRAPGHTAVFLAALSGKVALLSRSQLREQALHGRGSPPPALCPYNDPTLQLTEVSTSGNGWCPPFRGA